MCGYTSQFAWALVMALYVAFSPQELRPEERTVEHLQRVVDALPPAVLCDGDPEVTPELLLGIAFVETRLRGDLEGRVLPRFRRACEAGTSTVCPRPLGITQVVPGRWLPFRADELREPAGAFRASRWALMELRRHVGAEFVCRYGGSPAHCATYYEARVRAAAARIRRVQQEVLLSGRCMEPADVRRLSHRLQACIEVAEVATP